VYPLAKERTPADLAGVRSIVATISRDRAIITTRASRRSVI
jgi:hypothetical protein